MPALTAFLVSTVSLLLLVIFTQQERRRGRRFFASKFRTRLDRIVGWLEQELQEKCTHFIKYIVQLNWYYSIHSVLKAILRALVTLYAYFESIFERNRTRAKELRSEKRMRNKNNHLGVIERHRVDTALTPGEQRRLRKRTLEGKD